MQFQYKSKGPQTRASGVHPTPSEDRKRWISPSSQAGKKQKGSTPSSSISCSTQILTDWRMPTTLGKASYFTESTDSSTILTQKHRHRHSEAGFIQSTLWAANVAYKVHHHNCCISSVNIMLDLEQTCSYYLISESIQSCVFMFHADVIYDYPRPYHAHVSLFYYEEDFQLL